MTEIVIGPGITPIKDPGPGGFFAKIEPGQWDEVFHKFQGQAEDIAKMTALIGNLYDFEIKFLAENSPAITFVKLEYDYKLQGDAPELPTEDEILSIAGEFDLLDAVAIKITDEYYKISLFDVGPLHEAPSLLSGVDDLLG